MRPTRTYTKAFFALLIIALFALPLTLQLLSKPQANRSSAQEAEGTSLVFDPPSSEDDQLQVNAGEDLALTLQVIPGEGNRITFVKYIIEYDPEVFDATSDDFIASDAFPELLEAPVDEDGRIQASLSVGSDPEKAITTPTDVGEIVFHAKDVTKATPSTITIAEESEALSIGENDSLTESVLTTTDEAFVTVAADGANKAPSGNPNENAAGSNDAPEGTSVSFKALLHGIGAAGDSINPTNNSLSNKSPKNTSRPVTIAILDENGEDISRSEGEILYDEKTGKFAGSAIMDSFIPDGDYTVMVSIGRYLPFEKEITISDLANDVDLGEIDLVAGDIVPDGVLDILDYNTLTDCGYGNGNPLPINDPKSAYQSEACKENENAMYADLDNNGIINAQDFNLFLRELSAQNK